MPRSLTVLIVLLAAAARAQEDEVGRPHWVATPAATATALRSAMRAVVDQDWSGAAQALQKVIDRHPDAFAKTSREGSYVGARQRAVEMLATLPAAVREEYERIYGGPAEQALRHALAAGDRSGLLTVVRRFEATRAGLHAVLALADSAQLRGRPAEARLLLARLPRLHPQAAERDEVRRRLALSAARDHAQGGPPPRGSERAEGIRPVTARDDHAWPMMGGNATRTRIVPAPLYREENYSIELDIGERVWDRPTYPSRSSFYRRSPVQPGDWDDHWQDYAPVHPVVARGRLIFLDGRQVWAVNLYTGEVEWAYPPQSEVDLIGRTNLSTLFSPVVADGVVFATVEVAAPYVPQRLQGIPITYYLPARRLVAIDLETGEPLWSHEQDQEEPLSQLSVTGPPLVRGDRLYAGATLSEGTFHTFLVSVDRRTGDLIYATRLSSGQQELNLFGRQLNEAACTPVAEADGVLYLGTNLGVVVALDALLGAPLWARAYPVVPIPSTWLWYEAPRRWPRFENGPPLVVGDLLVLAPTDSHYLLGLSRGTGRILWKKQYVRGEVTDFRPRVLIGADEGHVYVSGSGGVAALDGKDGKVAWAAPFPREDDAGTGRGFLAEDGLWVPGYRGLYRFDSSSGKLSFEREREGRDELETVNLVWGDGVLVAAGRDFLSVRYEDTDVVRLARERVKRQPDGILPLLAAADIYLATGRVGMAVQNYRQARTRAEARGASAALRRAQAGLFRALLARAEQALQQEPERAPVLFDGAFAAAPDERSRLRARLRLDESLRSRSGAETLEWRLRNLRELERGHGTADLDETGRTVRGWALRQMADIYVERHQTKRAVAVLHQLAEQDPEGADGRQATAALRRILAREGREAYAPYEKRARRLFASALAAEDLDALERGLLIYSNAEAVGDAALALARARIARGELDAATGVLQRLLAEHPGAAQAPDALLLMVRALHERGSYGPAFSALRQLKLRHGDALVPRADGARVPARELAEEWLRREPYPAIARSARRLDLEADLQPRFERTFRSGGPVDVPDLQGQRPPALRDAVILRTGASLVALDAHSGRELYRLDFEGHEPRSPIVMAGDRLLVATEPFVTVFDARTGRTLARRGLPPDGRSPSLIEYRGQVFLLYRRSGRHGRPVVAAIHPEDASLQWSTEVPTSGAQERVRVRNVAGLEDRLVLLSERPVNLTVVNTTSGAVENRITVDTGRNTRLAVPPVVTPEGHLLVGLLTSEKKNGVAWELSYAIHLLDPAQPEPRAGAWPAFRPPSDGANRYLRLLNVVGQYVVALDDAAGAAVIDLRDGRRVGWVPRLDLGAEEGERLLLTAEQPRHESLLLVTTRTRDRSPARLAAFEMPNLNRRYAVELTESSTETADVIESQGVLGVMLLPRGPDRTPARIRLFDPATAKLLQELLPARGQLDWFTARVQNGVLIVAPAGNAVFAYGPR